MLIGCSPYQLALMTPGTSPRIASSRSLLRPRPNLRYTPRGRPVIAQRLRSRVGEASRGSFCSFSRAASRSSSARPGVAQDVEQRLPLGLEPGHGLAALLFAKFDGEFGHGV
jgi:hypothetical protein